MRKTLSAVIWVPLLLAGCGRGEGQKSAADAAGCNAAGRADCSACIRCAAGHR